MKYDIFGQSTSIAGDKALQHWNAAQLGFMAHSAKTPGDLAAALEAAPDFALGQAVRGMFLLLLGRRETVQSAREALTSAQEAQRRYPVTRRESRFIDALRVWLGGQPGSAVQVLERGLAEHPDDALAMKLGHAIRFVLGDAAGMRRSVERVLPAYGPDHPALGYLLGCQAFALEETGDYAMAERIGHKALDLCPDDAWGLHAVAHVHDMTGQPERGLGWLNGREAAWEHCNNFRYHVWWHKALMHLELGEQEEVLTLYDDRVRADRTDDYRDISNATALLMRLELDGVDVGDRWDELADLAAARTEDGCLIFADLHYLLALTGGRRDADTARLIRRIRQDGMSGASEAARRMAAPGTEAALGLQAFGAGRYAEAFAYLARARHSMQLAGGSHAQRDVFERMTIDAGLRAGLLDPTERILDDRTARRGGREDGYAAARRALISAGRRDPGLNRIPAE